MVVGWREPVDLPEWGITALKTKIDTGARTSAIHVANMEQLPGNRIRFDVIIAINRATHRTRGVRIEAPIVRTSRVRPSHGEEQSRPVVSTLMRLGPIERQIELSLVCRKRMLCRMLLGRTAIKGGFLIDPSHPTLLHHPPSTTATRKP